jgi:hypothetical protein
MTDIILTCVAIILLTAHLAFVGSVVYLIGRMIVDGIRDLLK